MRFKVRIPWNIRVGGRTDRTANWFVAIPDNLPEELIAANQSAAYYRTLRLFVLGALDHPPVHIYGRINRHSYIVRAVDLLQILKNLHADLVVDFFLILEFHGAGLSHLPQRIHVRICISRRIMDGNVGNFHSLHAVGHSVSDGRNHAVAQGLIALQLNGNRGRSRSRLRVQHIDPLSPWGNLYPCLPHSVKLADYRSQILLSCNEPRLVPFSRGIRHVLAVRVILIHKARGGIARHGQLGLELGFPPLWHQYAVPLDLVVCYSAITQECDDSTGLAGRQAAIQHGVLLPVHQHRSGNQQKQQHYAAGSQQNPGLLVQFCKKALNLFQKALQLCLHLEPLRTIISNTPSIHAPPLQGNAHQLIIGIQRLVAHLHQQFCGGTGLSDSSIHQRRIVDLAGSQLIFQIDLLGVGIPDVLNRRLKNISKQCVRGVASHRLGLFRLAFPKGFNGTNWGKFHYNSSYIGPKSPALQHLKNANPGQTNSMSLSSLPCGQKLDLT